jgi:hypothetical protein
MFHKMVVAALLLSTAACGVPGHTHDPSLANKPLPVVFHRGHVVSVQSAAIGFQEGALGITAGLAPGVILGAHIGPGYQPAGGRVGLAIAGVGIGPGIEAPAAALEYTVALDNSTQYAQISQYILPEDCQLSPNCVIPPGYPVLIRLVGNTGRVLPASLIPPQLQGGLRSGDLFGYGKNRPSRIEDCFGMAPAGTCRRI